MAKAGRPRGKLFGKSYEELSTMSTFDKGTFINQQVKNLSSSEAKTVLRTLAKRANQRIVDLEAKGVALGSNTYQYHQAQAFNDKKGFYSKTQRKRAYYRDNGKLIQEDWKFNTSTKGRSTQNIKAEIRRIADFLTKQTSTTAGVNQKYRSSYETYKRHKAEREAREGVKYKDMTFSEWAEFWNDTSLKTMLATLDSDQAVRIIEAVSKYGFNDTKYLEDTINELLYTKGENGNPVLKGKGEQAIEEFKDELRQNLKEVEMSKKGLDESKEEDQEEIKRIENEIASVFNF